MEGTNWMPFIHQAVLLDRWTYKILSFGLIKRLYRRTKFGSDIAAVVSKSSVANEPQLVGKQDGTIIVPIYDWVSNIEKVLRRYSISLFMVTSLAKFLQNTNLIMLRRNTI